MLHEHISPFVLHALCSPSSRQPLCKTAGCFLQTLSDPSTSYCRSFKPKKEELTSKLYQLYNTSVFDSKVSRTLYLLSNHWLNALLKRHLLCECFCSVRLIFFFFFVAFSFPSTCQSLGIRRCAKRRDTVSRGRSEVEETATPASNCRRKSAIPQVMNRSCRIQSRV